MTGVCGGTEDVHVGGLESQTVFYESRGGNIHGYTNNSYPNVSDVNSYLKISYYDDYIFPGAGNYTFNATGEALDVNKFDRVTGNVTAEKVKVLGISTNLWLTTVNYYNDKYQVIQNVSDLYPSGTEIRSAKYDFTGNVIQARIKQSVNGLKTKVDKYLVYDSHGRLKKVSQKIDGDNVNNTVNLVEFEYDELGRVHHKKIHNQAETMVYAYDVAGRLNSFTSSKFSYNIGYDQTGGLTEAKPFYGGNISYMSWQNGSTSKKAYVYDYDGLNQLKKADFREKSGTSWTDPAKYDVSNLSYDENGNIESLVRKNSSGGVLHNLSYAYSGNKVASVSNNGSQSSTYDYNENGNMTFDGRKGITITYNILNLPERISKGSQSISYIYSADGQKLAMQYGSSLIYYRGGLIYNGNDLDKIIHEEGLVVKSSGGYNYYYALKDHLGSTRVLCKAGGSTLTTEQTTEYYPFGLAFSYNSVDKNSYLFSGKEYQNEVIGGTKLELYDFGSRYYDTELGRWFALDPAMQLVSPYGYCMNNPMIYVDPDGESFFTFLIELVANIFLNTAEKMVNHEMSFENALMNSLQSPQIVYAPSIGYISTRGIESLKVELGMQKVVSNLEQKVTNIKSSEKERSNYFKALNGIMFNDGKVYYKKDFVISFKDDALANARYLGYRNGKHHINFDIGEFEETIPNIRVLTIHEAYGHGVKGYGSATDNHHLVYFIEINSKYWEATTPTYKRITTKYMWEYYYREVGYKRMPEPYQSIYDKFHK